MKPMRIGNTVFDFKKTYICGVLNVTPDSFSDGGLFMEEKKAIEHAKQLVADGADIIDIGGESSRPGSEPVSAEEELRRVKPVIQSIRKQADVPISIDTCKPEVAEECISLGADVVNDITGLASEVMADVVSRHGVAAVLMHMKGRPRDMQLSPAYENVIKEIFDFFEVRLEKASELGIDKIIIDPGLGFGKTAGHNISIIRNLHAFTKLGRPVMVGPSRKSFIGSIAGGAPSERLEGTIASCAISVINGANIVRVHDVKECKKAVAIADAVARAA
ncbi:MAG: dihydropteroate synthase [Candidatus Aenigmarchaeota archaeon]|nr:dihydropteroate synthase [Candidatus Aenigmarchaeota archaeon]